MAHLFLRQGTSDCPDHFQDCNGSCVSTLTSAYNCGACGNSTICDIPPNGTTVVACQNGTCTILSSCPPELTACGNVCYDFSSDSTNCGSCGHGCAPSLNYNPGPCWNSICVSSYPSTSRTMSVLPGPPTSTTNPSTSATSTLTSTTTTNSHTNPPGPNVPTGVAAGIGVGCAIVGALLAGLVAVFIFSRRNRPRTRDQQAAPPSDNMGGYAREEKSGVTTAIATIPNIPKYLVHQPAEDDTMTRGLLAICEDIKNHVQNYYHMDWVDRQDVDEARLVGLSGATAIPTRDMVDLLINTRKREPMLRLFLAHFILSRCTEQADGTQSFLPSELSEVLAFKGLNIADQSSTAHQIDLLSKWKAVSGTLLERRYSELPSGNDPRLARIEEALDASEPILHPFIDKTTDETTRRNNLREVMKLAAQYAFLMFSQPCSYSFDYTRTSRPDSLVVFPALLITVNHEGKRLSPPRVLEPKKPW